MGYKILINYVKNLRLRKAILVCVVDLQGSSSISNTVQKDTNPLLFSNFLRYSFGIDLTYLGSLLVFFPQDPIITSNTDNIMQTIRNPSPGEILKNHFGIVLTL